MHHLPTTSTVNEHVARFPAWSTAWQTTSVSPMSKWLLIFASHVTVGVSLALSVDSGSVQTTSAVDFLGSVWSVLLLGQITIGASVSVKGYNCGGLVRHQIVSLWVVEKCWGKNLLYHSPRTSMINEHVAWFASWSRAWHITSVSPISNWLPFCALQVTVGVSLELSVATGSVQTTNAVDLLRSVSSVWLVGQITVGASVSV